MLIDTELETKKTHIPSPDEKTIRIVTLGGVEEIGKNMHIMEYKDSIIIFDCGLMFAEAQTPGIDCIVPNIDYLIERKKKIKAIVISHGHLDHIGALPFVIDRLGYPPVYSRKLTIALMQKRQKEHLNLKPVDFREIETNETVSISDDITLDFFAVTHTIPDAMGIIANTPFGGIVYTGDLKLDHEDGVVSKEEEASYDIFKKKKILLTMADSTNACRTGFSIPERRVTKAITELIEGAQGRVILGAFSSQIDRIISIVENVERMGKKVFVLGRSMIDNVRIATELGMLNHIGKNVIVNVKNIEEYRDNQIVVMSTGSQGEEFTGLHKIATGSHKQIKAKKSDIIILSSSIVPGNEQRVWSLKDKLSRAGASLVTFETSDVHSSGHANIDELFWIHSHIKSKFFIPIHGYHYMLVSHGAVLTDTGMKRDHIVIPDNGSIIDIKEKGEYVEHRKEKVPSELTMIDGNTILAGQDVVFDNRKILAENGMVIISIIIDKKRNNVRMPRFTSRGFIYIRESSELMNKSQRMIQYLVRQELRKSEGTINKELIKKIIIKRLNTFFFQHTGKRPLITPIIFISGI